MAETYELRELPAMRIAAYKMHCRYEECGEGFPILCKKVQWRAAGKPFCLYHELKEPTEKVDLECCIPVKPSMRAQDGIEVRELEGCRAVVCTHHGPYHRLKETYAALEAYVREQGWKTTLPVREVYIKGPGMFLKGNPEKYVTEIRLPICED